MGGDGHNTAWGYFNINKSFEMFIFTAIHEATLFSIINHFLFISF
jgi:hypothetical protein